MFFAPKIGMSAFHVFNSIATGSVELGKRPRGEDFIDVAIEEAEEDKEADFDLEESPTQGNLPLNFLAAARQTTRQEISSSNAEECMSCI